MLRRNIISIIMKDFVLSLLSRGHSQVVQAEGGGQYRRLEVFFEPEDYFNWKSQPSLLHLSNSGRLLGGVDPAPPKTYSTRRGPLILYSEEFARSSFQTDKVSRKGRAFRTSRGSEVEVQLHTLQDLTEAILAYGKKQAKVGCHVSSVTQPFTPVSKRATQCLPSCHRPREEHDHVIQPRGEGQSHSMYPKLGQATYQPHFLCSPQPHRPPPGPLPPIIQSPALRHSGNRPHVAPGDPQKKAQEDQGISKAPRTAIRIPRVQMSPIPEAETGTREEHKQPPEDQMVSEHLTCYPKDINGQWKQSAKETGGEEGSHSLRPVYIDPSLGCSHLSKITNNRRHMEGACQQDLGTDTHARRLNTPPNPTCNVFNLPPINQAPPSDLDCKEHGGKTGGSSTENQKDLVLQLPDIHHPDISTEVVGHKPPEKPILKKVLVLLPSSLKQDVLRGLPEDGEERKDGFPEKEKRQDILWRSVEQNREATVNRGENDPLDPDFRLKAAEQESVLIWFEPEEDKECQTTPGPLPPLVGRRGPGKQSSMAFYRQDPRDPADQTEPGITRGSLPLQLRECEKGRALGTLIMGPAGEIIRLSLWDDLTDTEDHPVLDDATREHVLRVLTSEGILEQPWTVLLEEQPTQAEEMNNTYSKLDTTPGHRTQVDFKQEDRDADEHTRDVKKPEPSGTDGKRTGDPQASAPQQRTGNVKTCIEETSIENLAYSRGEDTKIKSRGRTQGLQPEGEARPRSPKTTSTSARSSQKTVLSTPTAVEEVFHKVKPEIQTFKDTASDSKTRSSKAGGGDHAEQPQIRTVKKTGEADQHVRGRIENKHAEKKNVQTNMGKYESQDSSYTAETSPSPIPEKKKTTKEVKKPKDSTSQAKKSKSQTKESKIQLKESRHPPQESRSQPQESTQSQSNGTKVKKKPKAQAAFVVGKPRQSQEVHQVEKEVEKAGRPERTASKTEENEPEEEITEEPIDESDDEPEDEPEKEPVDHQCCEAHGQSLDTDLVSVYQDDRTVSASSSTYSFIKKSSTGSLSSRRTSIAETHHNPALLSLTQLSQHSAAPQHHPPSHPAKSEASADAKSSDEAVRDSKAAALAEKAERRRLEVERKRKEREEERRRQQEREEREERMRLELEEEQKQRADQARLKRLKEEEERQKQKERENEQQRRQKAEEERERRRQEEKRRLLERLQRERQEEEERRAAELKRRQLEEEAQREQERRKLEEMEESERLEYLRKKQEEEEERRKATEERRRAEKEAAVQAEEEARMLAELYARQRAALEQQLRFNRSLFVEAGGLEQTQDISRPWVFSYFTLLKLLGLTEPPPAPEDLVKDVL